MNAPFSCSGYDVFVFSGFAGVSLDDSIVIGVRFEGMTLDDSLFIYRDHFLFPETFTAGSVYRIHRLLRHGQGQRIGHIGSDLIYLFPFYSFVMNPFLAALAVLGFR